MTTVILANDAGAGRRLRGQPHRLGHIDTLLFLLAQFCAEVHCNFCHG
jgi:hypothetical protein